MIAANNNNKYAIIRYEARRSIWMCNQKANRTVLTWDFSSSIRSAKDLAGSPPHKKMKIKSEIEMHRTAIAMPYLVVFVVVIVLLNVTRSEHELLVDTVWVVDNVGVTLLVQVDVAAVKGSTHTHTLPNQEGSPEEYHCTKILHL